MVTKISPKSVGAPDVSNAAAMSDASGTLAELPSPDETSLMALDPAIAIAMIEERYLEQSSAAKEDERRAEEKAQYDEESRQVDAMREEASSIRAGGIVTGSLDVATGGVQTCGAFAQYDADIKASSYDGAKLSDAKPAAGEIEALGGARASAMKASALLHASEKAFEASKSIAGARSQAAETDSKAEQKRHEQLAHGAGAQADAARDAERAYGQTIERAHALIGEILDAKHQMALAIWSRG